MRAAFLALVSVCALAACNPSAPNGDNAAPSVSDVFPNLTSASFRAEANITREGQTLPVVMIRDGQKLRMEISAPQGQSTIITNGETGESFIIATAMGQTHAMRLQQQDNEDPTADWQGELATATRTGSCSVAGENGAEWTRDENGAPHTACVTSDGIILRAAEGGQTVWETTSVQRGPQAADLFVLPEGVQVIDLNNLGSAIENLARSQGGQ
ncbi:MAG: hypothetical protein M0D54_01735 [Hyphomonadaceae bacterium JAD_PAG50586_4]|nr:MAG: hypothetical protein M0D54_01735 [Hyphomonadaceae bacterium JAD_PAG50586_4]